MLKVNNVSKYYDDFLAVDNLSFEVNKGEIFGLLGVNGAGKTTTFRMIMGLLDISSGNNIGYLTEERSLLTKLTVKQQCYFIGKLKNMEDDKIEKRLNELLKLFNIEEYKNKKIKELSKGNQQKIQFITAILNEPKLLILDEPFSGLDPINIELFKQEISNLSKKGSAIIFSSHRMEHVELFCKKLLILLKGKTVLEGNLSDIKKNYRKKNIIIKGDIDIDKIKNIDGVEEIIQKSDEYEIKISSLEVSDKVFSVISKNKNITKFIVEEPSLNEIFISKVGEAYE